MSSDLRRVGELQIDEDPRFARRNWAAQRVGWAAMTLFLAASIAGVFGNGPVSRREARSEDGKLRVEYERYPRHEAPSDLSLRFEKGVASAGRIRLRIPLEYLEKFRIEQILPEPDVVEAAEDATVYVLNVAEPEEPADVHIRVKPEGYRAAKLHLKVEGGPELHLEQYIYP